MMTAQTATVVRDIGQIRSIRLPAAYQERPDEAVNDAVYVRKFSHSENTDVAFVFFYRGRRLPQASAESFLRTLALAPHEVEAAEFGDLDLVVREASNPENFILSSCRTENKSGRRVLIVEGIWKASGLVEYGVFIDSDGTGSAVQELHFNAPQIDYADHIDEIEALLDNIAWKRG